MKGDKLQYGMKLLVPLHETYGLIKTILKSGN